MITERIVVRQGKGEWMVYIDGKFITSLDDELNEKQIFAIMRILRKIERKIIEGGHHG